VNRRLAVFGAAAAAAVALGLASAHATAPGENGRIAFERFRLSDKPLWAEVYVVNPDGTGERKVSHAPRGYADSDPDWAPDGSRIVFQRCFAGDNGTCYVYVVNGDGSGERRLSPRCGPRFQPSGPGRSCVSTWDGSPVYSPDGRLIAFARDSWKWSSKGATYPGSAICAADGNLRHVRVIQRGGDVTRVAWSPDAKQIAFVDDSKGPSIFVVNVNGKPHLRRATPRGLRAGADRIDWSPDGSRILFRTQPNPGTDAGGNLFTIRPDGTGLRQLTHFDPYDRNEGALWNGSYSPDGSSVVFSTIEGAVGQERDLVDVFVMSADGTDIRPVTRELNWDGTPDWGAR
jgi:TolB protein